MKTDEGSKTGELMIGTSLRSSDKLTPQIIDEFNRSFALTRTLPCDVQLGDHAGQYNLRAKYAELRRRISEAMVRAIAAEQGAHQP